MKNFAEADSGAPASEPEQEGTARKRAKKGAAAKEPKEPPKDDLPAESSQLCHICAHPTEEGKRVETGGKNKSYMHHGCSNACKALDRAAERKDQTDGKGLKTHREALGKLKEKNPLEWKNKVLALVVQDGSRRGAVEREKAARFVEEIVAFSSVYKRREVKYLPKRAFLAHFQFKEGYTSQEAEDEWTAALEDPDIDRQVDENGAQKR